MLFFADAFKGIFIKTTNLAKHFRQTDRQTDNGKMIYADGLTLPLGHVATRVI